MSELLSVEWIGETSYADALALQHQAVADRLAGRTGDRLLLFEHPKVITLGRSTDRANLRYGEARLREMGVELFEVGRGGDVTYHAPGQLVGYPIIDLDALGLCMEERRYEAFVQADFSAGQGAGVTGTPAFFINGRFLSGAKPFEAFKVVIDQELKKG